MRLADWVDRFGRGAIAHLARETGLSYQRVHALARDPDATAKLPTARLISRATRNAVTVFELLESATQARARTRARRRRKRITAAAA